MSWVRPGAAAAGAAADVRAARAAVRGHHRVLGGPFRRRRAAPGRGRHVGAPDRQAVPRVQRPGLPGENRAIPIVYTGSGAQQAGDRAGRTAGLDRRACRLLRLFHSRGRAGLAGRPEEAEAWWRRVERTIRPEAEPVAVLAVYHVRGRVELA